MSGELALTIFKVVGLTCGVAALVWQVVAWRRAARRAARYRRALEALDRADEERFRRLGANSSHGEGG